MIESLETIGGTHGIGRSDAAIVKADGSRFREVAEAPAAVTLHVAHAALTAAASPKALAALIGQVGAAYADLIQSGQWFTAHARCARCLHARGPGAGHRLGAPRAPSRRLPRRLERTGALRPPDAAGGHRRWPHSVGTRSRGTSLVRKVRRRSRRGARRVRPLVRVRSPPLRGRRARQRCLGDGARARRRADARRRGQDPARPGRRACRRAAIPPSSIRRAAAADEDVHAFVERELVQRIGDAGRRLHTGRSRNEQVAVDLRLYLKRRLPQLQRSLVALIDVLVTSASSAPDRRADAVVHAPAARAADPRRAFLSRPRFGAPPRSRPPRPAARRRRRTAARLRRHRRHQLSHRRRRARPRPRLRRASSATASTRPAIATSSPRFSTSAR